MAETAKAKRRFVFRYFCRLFRLRQNATHATIGNSMQQQVDLTADRPKSGWTESPEFLIDLLQEETKSNSGYRRAMQFGIVLSLRQNK